MNRFYKLILYTVGDAVAIRLTVKLLSLVPQIILFLLTMLLSAYLLSSDSKHLRNCARHLLPQVWTDDLLSLLRRLKKSNRRLLPRR